jgi:superfamily II DNA or RNA helicase
MSTLKNKEPGTRLTRKALCIRKASNTAKISKVLPKELQGASAKYLRVIEQIQTLDAEDMKQHGTKFKHFLFTDIRESAYGAKAMGLFLSHAGFDFRMRAGPRGGALLTEADPVKKGSDGFALLQSLPMWGQPLTVKTREKILETYNRRPDNIHGELLRILVLDSKYKEGIDLYDVKYVHLLEPPLAESDMKQAVGRGTRLCGQKGLPFIPNVGWPLHVFIYTSDLPSLPPFVKTEEKGLLDAHELMMKNSGIDLSLLKLINVITDLAIDSSVDYDLNKKVTRYVPPVQKGGGKEGIKSIEEWKDKNLTRCSTRKSNRFPFTTDHMREVARILKLPINVTAKRETYCKLLSSSQAFLDELLITQGKSRVYNGELGFPSFQKQIRKIFGDIKWSKPPVKNRCGSGNKPYVLRSRLDALAKYTPTQNFLRQYFRPDSPFKGMLAWHSVGTGKTCTAIAVASSSFEQAGYRILWVTRFSLMEGVWKNMFGIAGNPICSEPIREHIREGKTLPADLMDQRKLISKGWNPPISYRMLQNALQKKNELGRSMYEENPDPLYKTFLIIDEIHKLQDGDLSTSEAANFKIIQEYIYKSYQLSGEYSVRPFFMTATPITKSPVDLFEIVNTLIPDPKKRLPPWEDVRKHMIVENAEGEFSINAEGVKLYQARAKGLISYLNREKDPSNFAQPKIQTIHVPVQVPVSLTPEDIVKEYMKESKISHFVKEDDCTLLEEQHKKDVAKLDSLAPKERTAKTLILNKTFRAKRKDCIAKRDKTRKINTGILKDVQAMWREKRDEFAKQPLTQYDEIRSCFGEEWAPEFPIWKDVKTVAEKKLSERQKWFGIF